MPNMILVDTFYDDVLAMLADQSEGLGLGAV